jgi:hypothetical protein
VGGAPQDPPETAEVTRLSDTSCILFYLFYSSLRTQEQGQKPSLAIRSDQKPSRSNAAADFRSRASALRGCHRDEPRFFRSERKGPEGCEPRFSDVGGLQVAYRPPRATFGHHIEDLAAFFWPIAFLLALGLARSAHFPVWQTLPDARRAGPKWPGAERRSATGCRCCEVRKNRAPIPARNNSLRSPPWEVRGWPFSHNLLCPPPSPSQVGVVVVLAGRVTRACASLWDRRYCAGGAPRPLLQEARGMRGGLRVPDRGRSGGQGGEATDASGVDRLCERQEVHHGGHVQGNDRYGARCCRVPPPPAPLPRPLPVLCGQAAHAQGDPFDRRLSERGPGC